MDKQGLPANVNPFCVVDDHCLCDGLHAYHWPGYFAEIPRSEPNRNPCGVTARADVQMPALSQQEAEAFVRDVHDHDCLSRVFAVKEEWKHLIPADLRKSVLVAKTTEGHCLSDATYYLE